MLCYGNHRAHCRAARGPGSIVSALVSRARVVTGMDIASAAVRDADGQFPMPVYRGVRSRGIPRAADQDGRRPRRAGAAHRRAGPARRLPHSAADHPGLHRGAVDVEGIHGIVCVPVLGPDGVNALLYAAVRTTGTPGDIAVVRLEGLAAEAGTALHHLAARASAAELPRSGSGRRSPSRLHDSIAQTLFSVGALARRSRSRRDPVLLTQRPRGDRDRRRRRALRSADDAWPICAGCPTGAGSTWRWSPRAAPSPPRPRCRCGGATAERPAGAGDRGVRTDHRRAAGRTAERGQACPRRPGDGDAALGRAEVVLRAADALG